MSYLKLAEGEQPCPDCTDGDVRTRYACTTCGDEGVVPVDEEELQDDEP